MILSFRDILVFMQVTEPPVTSPKHREIIKLMVKALRSAQLADDIEVRKFALAEEEQLLARMSESDESVANGLAGASA